MYGNTLYLEILMNQAIEYCTPIKKQNLMGYRKVSFASVKIYNNLVLLENI